MAKPAVAMRTSLLLSILVVVIGCAVAQWGWQIRPLRCGPGEVWKVCESSSCGEEKCDARGPRPCTADCQTRCFCESGYYRRRADNKCVPLSQC